MAININLTHEGDRMQKEFEYIEKHLYFDPNGQKRFKNGVDIGCGTNRISQDIVSIDAQPDPRYANNQLIWDCINLDIFSNEVLDFIFSSHCLEDFSDIKAVFQNWWSKLKTNGLMILLLPDMEICNCGFCKGKTRYPTIEDYEKTGKGNPSHRTNVGKKFIEGLLQDLKEHGVIDYNMLQCDTIPHNESCSIDFVIEKIK